jgi:mono/diheme cytochrome c family protein
MKSAIYLSGFVLLASFILILIDDFGQEWKSTQSAFTRIEENRFFSTAEGGLSFDGGIRQIVVDGLNKVDRCPTCHLGMNDPKYQHADPPFTSHPGNLLTIHKVERFGCTSCHLGQEFAVTYRGAAHQALPFWNETMLPKPLLQASCATCHLSMQVPDAGIPTAGRLLIKEKGCAGCHDISELFEVESRGPDLDGIGNKVTRAWLFHWLKNPRDYLKDSRMPSFRLSDDEIIDLVEFLMSLNGKDSPPHFVKLLPSRAGDPEKGKILVSESRCITCHAINARGGKFAPELERVGDKVREEWLANFLRNVHYYQPDKKMLEYNFTDQDALDIAAYIRTEFSEEPYLLPQDAPATGMPLSSTKTQERAKRGEQLFSRFGCGGCHTIAGEKKYTKVGPKLTDIGNRLESSLEFGTHTDVVPTLYNWLFMKLKQPETFDSVSIMPNFYLSDQEAFEIVVALLGNRESGYASEYFVHESERSIYKKPAGEFGKLFEKFSCISCHSVDRYGGNISTVPLTMEGSKVKFDWLRDYLVNPYPIRPILTERMPQFRMTVKEASLMADYIKTVYVSDDIPRFFELELTVAGEVAGSRLFYSMQCINCHIINGKGGYVGPQLDDLGTRLEAGWVYQWLLHPLKYKPETLHPDFGFTDGEARQLAAYLTQKKGRQK